MDDGNDFLLNEQLCLLEGLVRAWHAVRLPKIQAEFDVVDVEKEIAWELAPGIRLMVRMDAVLRRKTDKLLFVKDYKTVSAVFDDFGKKYEHDSQLLAYTLAAEGIYNEPIGGLLMEGVIKGKRARDKALSSPFRDTIIQQSPLCYGYKAKVKNQPGQFLLERSWSAGAEKVPVWDMRGGIQEWLHDWSPLDMAELFVVPPAIKPMRRDLERWHRQAVAQERQIQADVLFTQDDWTAFEKAIGTPEEDAAWDTYQQALDTLFPQNHNHCFRYFGYPCAMERLCFTEAIEADPLASGFYDERIPHHSTEEDA
jgi:hypothetical protein